LAALVFDIQDQKHTKNWGIFGEGTYLFSDTMRLTAGVRYDDTKVTLTERFTINNNLLCGTFIRPIGVDPVCTGAGQPEINSTFLLDNLKLNFHNFNYKVRLEYDLTSGNMLYGMVSTGFRPGDAGVTGNPRRYR
jgi:iron complex outermembrane receptor protein